MDTPTKPTTTFKRTSRNSFKEQCRLFVAPSTIPNAGLGIFTGIELEQDDTIGYADMVIPVPKIASSIRNPIEDYAWHGRIYRGSMDAFAPGFLSLMNSHLPLLNIGQIEPAANVFPQEMDATKYHYLQSMAEEHVPPGGELFTFYGDHWFEGRDRYKGRPMRSDFKQAEELTKRFHSLAPTNATHARDLWKIIRRFPFRSHTLQAFPHKYEYVHDVVTNGVRSLHQPYAVRSVEELMYGDNSRCLDMIRQGPSKVHNLGALANMAISRGTVITGSPLIVTTKERMDSYGQVWDSFVKDYRPSKSTRHEYSLLMNYCFGHVSSTILLCPYGIAVSYINHSRRRPNVAIRWTPNHELSQLDWSFTQSPLRLADHRNITLSMDYVAIRDIKKDEEVVIDYGKAWDQAYKGHSRQQLQPLAVSVEKYNHQPVLLTEAEQQTLPYPINLGLQCHSNILDSPMQFVNKDLWKKSSIGYDCQILERYQHPEHPQVTVYAVRMMVKDTFRSLGGVPRDYVRFVEKEVGEVPFRFPMQLPDKMVPNAWRDAK